MGLSNQMSQMSMHGSRTRLASTLLQWIVSHSRKENVKEHRTKEHTQKERTQKRRTQKKIRKKNTGREQLVVSRHQAELWPGSKVGRAVVTLRWPSVNRAAHTELGLSKTQNITNFQKNIVQEKSNNTWSLTTEQGQYISERPNTK